VAGESLPAGGTVKATVESRARALILREPRELAKFPSRALQLTGYIERRGPGAGSARPSAREQRWRTAGAQKGRIRRFGCGF